MPPIPNSINVARVLSYRELVNVPAAFLTCEVCGHVNTPNRAFYWGTCSACEEVKGQMRAAPLPACGHYAAGAVDEYGYDYGRQR